MPLSIFVSAVPVGLVVYLIIYVVYQRYLHPLAKFPGPFLASLTDLWQVSEFLSLKQPYNLTALHERYGQFVRYGPEKISTTAEDAIPIIYQKGGRMFPKPEFYDAYWSGIPSVFGVRDESVRTLAIVVLNLSLTQPPRFIPFDGDTCRTASPCRM